MNLFKTKVWSWLDIGLLKWSSFLFGMIIGAYLTGFVRQYVWLFLIVAILCAVRPAIAYFKD
jgi:hypothetical protein